MLVRKRVPSASFKSLAKAYNEYLRLACCSLCLDASPSMRCPRVNDNNSCRFEAADVPRSDHKAARGCDGCDVAVSCADSLSVFLRARHQVCKRLRRIKVEG